MKYVATLLVGLALLLPALAIFSQPSSIAHSGTVVSFNDPKYQCNRYGDPKSNFEILSIVTTGSPDDPRGQYLNANVDEIKNWILTRWAFPNNQFDVKCKVIVTPTKDVFKELFTKDSPQYRIVREGGQLKELTIWLSGDDPCWHTSTLTNVLTEVCLQELEAKYGKVGLWVHRGMPILNGPLPGIRQNLGNLALVFDKNLQVYSSKELLTMTPETLASQPPASSVWYDSESACFMLMLYKEFGARKFNTFLAQCRSGDPEVALRTVYGWNTYAECDVAFRQYMQNLSRDLTGRGTQVTPNSYLTWPVPGG